MDRLLSIPFALLLFSLGRLDATKRGKAPAQGRKPPWQHRAEQLAATRQAAPKAAPVQPQSVDTWLTRFRPFAQGLRNICPQCFEPVFPNGEDFFCPKCRIWIDTGSAMLPQQWRARFQANFEAIDGVFGAMRRSGHLFEALSFDFQPSRRCRGGPGPQTNVQWLLQLACSGGNPAQVLDQVGRRELRVERQDFLFRTR